MRSFILCLFLVLFNIGVLPVMANQTEPTREREYRYPVPAQFEFAYIDTTGNEIILAPFLFADDFPQCEAKQAVAPVKVWIYDYQDGKLKLNMDLSHLQVGVSLMRPDGSRIRTQFRRVQPFLDGQYSVAHTDGGMAIIDSDGHVQSQFDGHHTTGFREGLCAVSDSRYRFVDLQGKDVIGADFDTAQPFSEGLALVGKYGRFMSKLSMGFIDKSGKEVIPFKFSEARSFSEGLAACSDGHKWGYIDKTGKVIVPFTYDFAFDFTEGLAAVEKNEKVGFIDASGKTVIDFQFADARNFSAGLAPVTKDGRIWGYIDKSGKEKIAARFLSAFPFACGRALVFIEPRESAGQKTCEAPFLLDVGRRARVYNHIEEARAMFKRAIELAPQTAVAQTAERFLRTALPAKATDQAIVDKYQYACVLSSRDPAAAQAQLEQCIKEAPQFDWAYGALAQVLGMQGKWQEGEALLKPVLERNPHYLRGYYRLYELYQGAGKSELAQSMLEKARSLNADDEIFEPENN